MLHTAAVVVITVALAAPVDDLLAPYLGKSPNDPNFYEKRKAEVNRDGTSAHNASASASLYGWSALGRIDKVSELIALRADVNHQDKGGNAAIHAATRRDHTMVAAILVQAGANPEIMDARGLRPIHVAAAHGHGDAVTGLLVAGASFGKPPDQLGQQPLHLAARMGHVEPTAALIQANADLNALDSERCTPLHLAAFEGHAHVAALLLDSGADADLLDAFGQTPLHWAARGHTGVVRVLLQRGAKPSIRDSEGRVPADWAEHGGHDDILHLLLAGEGPEAAASSVAARHLGLHGAPTSPWVVDLTAGHETGAALFSQKR
eukprot:TRINITY_DN62928_c0_g1_i1.p1 TRINITY_DN62928_c0_g1~~TRINITY_DN62928_c0_g1_i1.p1  ORF type:complete len:320 (-),score=51.06 TRINITY_DN62928_c0_g1_i1:43-1002(-)